jgi:hypothetical protein
MKSPTYALALLLAVAALGGFPTSAHAHRTSDACIRLHLDGPRLEGRLEIALRDLAHLVQLDPDGDGNVTWGEVRSAEAAIRRVVTQGLRCVADTQPLELAPGEVQISDIAGEPAASLAVSAAVPTGSRNLEIHYGLLFDLDPEHRGLLGFSGSGPGATFVFSPDRRQASFSLNTPAPDSAWDAFTRFIGEGLHHIAIGFDHILFLVALLLPSVFRRDGSRLTPVDDFAPVFRNVLGVVTAFTVAHSITLALAATGLVRLPSRWVETAIAASVALAAINNLVPLLRDRSWYAAAGFGLIHGFGFAGVLQDLALPPAQFAVGLLGFNLGVELGQLLLVALFLPFAFALRDGWVYRRLILQAGSTAIVVLSAVWMAQRAFELGG